MQPGPRNSHPLRDVRTCSGSEGPPVLGSGLLFEPQKAGGSVDTRPKKPIATERAQAPDLTLRERGPGGPNHPGGGVADLEKEAWLGLPSLEVLKEWRVSLGVDLAAAGAAA